MIVLVLATAVGFLPPQAQLCPPPKHILSSSKPLPAAGVRVLGGTSKQAKYARAMLRRLVGTSGGGSPSGGRITRVLLREAASAQQVARAARDVGLPAPPEDAFPESYVVAPGGQEADVIITAGPTGLIYGADTVGQLLLAPSPRLAAISDWPTMRERGYTGCARRADTAGLRRMDWFATWRLNAMYYEIYGDQGQDSVPPEVEDVARECRRRGIRLYGLISNWRTIRLLKRPLCPSRPEDLARIRRYATELLDRGCQGLIFLFDDIPSSQVHHPQTCPLCKNKYPTLASLQIALMKPMLEVGRSRGINHFIVCPTPYYVYWKKSYGDLDGCAYFREWSKAPELTGVGEYHCVIRRSRIQEVRDCGLRNYVYWFNGLRNFFNEVPGRHGPPGTWAGLGDLAWSWYLDRWDPRQGTVAQPDAYQALRELPQLTRRAWICGGGWFPWAMWGAYLWDADRLDDAALRREVIARLYGPSAAEAYLRWEKAAHPALARIVSPSFSEALLHRHELTDSLSLLARQARAAADQIATAASAAQASALLPAEDRQSLASQALRTAEALSRFAQQAAGGKASVTVGKPATTPLAQGGRRVETRFTLSRGLFSYRLRYSQTIEADGRKHRSQWHFGSGLGMTGPSNRNWYDAGFFDLLVNGQSLDALTPKIEKTRGDQGEALKLTWTAEAARVTLVLLPRLNGGLQADGQIEPRQPIKSLQVQLFAIPGARQGGWKDMDKAVLSPQGLQPHGKPVNLKPGENWLFYEDRHYDVPLKHAEGPCALLWEAPGEARISTDNSPYVVTTRVDLPADCQGFDFVVYDFHGVTNQEALNYFQRTVLRKP